MDDSLSLKSFRLKNFKAIRDSGEVRFTPLTVFIGNNGSGKSSIIEGLETFQTLVMNGLDVSMNRWRGFENIRNQAAPHERNAPDEDISFEDDALEETDYVSKYGFAEDEEPPQAEGRSKEPNPIEAQLSRQVADGLMEYSVIINSSPSGNELFIQSEVLDLNGNPIMRRYENGNAKLFVESLEEFSLTDGESIISTIHPRHTLARSFAGTVSLWQFAMLNPDSMGDPIPRTRTGSAIKLARNGANIAEYLLDIRNKDQDAFDGIIETLQYVLPYAVDLQPSLTSEIERAVYLQMTEGGYKIPGWLLSSGTLRILALLALFRHPEPPPLIVIEEIENGLDPRTLHLIVEELRNLIETGTTQVIITTHSPYLLDLLALSQIVLVERIDGQPTFFRPSDQATLEEWAKDFGPGRLYTMNKLSQGSSS
jgi:predicted ATPase